MKKLATPMFFEMLFFASFSKHFLRKRKSQYLFAKPVPQTLIIRHRLFSLTSTAFFYYNEIMNEMITLSQAKPEIQRKFMTGVYLRMTLALFISATVAYFASNSYAVLSFLFSRQGIPFYVLLIAEFVLVIALSGAIHKLSSFAAMAFFLLYAVMNGLSLCTIFILYEVRSIYTMFLVSALMFAGMSIYGATTKSDLTSVGRYLFMGLIGIIVAGLVNMFLRSSALDWITSLVGVGLFIGITAYDTQRLLRIAIHDDGSENFRKVSIIGALELYLDFINIFLKMLALFGKKRR